ncbi:Lsr2 family DNA-binding protein [Streptomyces sp. NBC_01264]|uniref:Lsr2 family DNA-binding protein n=1 Tax=Streptomyces sp. NBC_01264 TaxID=2903804 RepID=UPI003D2FA94E
MTKETESRVHQALKDEGTSMPAAWLIRETGLKRLDLVAMENRGVLLSDLVRVRPGWPVIRVYRLPYAQMTAEEVRGHAVRRGLVERNDGTPVTAAEYRLYDRWLRSQDRLAVVRESHERKQAEVYARLNAQDAAAAWVRNRSARIRLWGIANGHRVGERGRLPAWLVTAYEADQGDVERRGPQPSE